MPDPQTPNQQARAIPIPGRERLAALLDRNRKSTDAADVDVVFAHPDDETIGCGAQLARWKNPTLVLVTDGAPVNLKDARALGFSTAKDYAGARRRELLAALAIAGQPPQALVTFDIPDQQVARRLVEVTHRLMELAKARDLRVFFTHAYEGGHPDHDATAFAVHAAARLLSTEGRPVLVVEMPYYKTGDGDMTRQRFSPAPEVQEITIPLTPDEQDLKRRMMAAHQTQAAILAPFDVATEHFRIAPQYDFAELPNEGRLLYEQQDWGLTGSEWLALARAAISDLGLGGKPC